MIKEKNGSVTVLLKITPETWKAYVSQQLKGTLVFSNKQKVVVHGFEGDHIVTETKAGALHRYSIKDGVCNTRKDYKNYRYIRIKVTFNSLEECMNSEWAQYITRGPGYYARQQKQTDKQNAVLFLDTLMAVADAHKRAAEAIYNLINNWK
jgi:hypothetical protein